VHLFFFGQWSAAHASSGVSKTNRIAADSQCNGAVYHYSCASFHTSVPNLSI